MSLDGNYVVPYGEAVLDFGLVVREAVDGYGLMTHGLLWQTPVTWLNETLASSPSTSWTPYSDVITTWTKSTDTTTTWANDNKNKGFFDEGGSP